MSKTTDTVETAYGRLDAGGLRELQDSFDTHTLLQMIDGLDEAVAEITDEEGLRDALLRLHGMAHTVINGATLTVAAEGESLTELAFDVTMTLRDMVSTLNGWIKHLEKLERLEPG